MSFHIFHINEVYSNADGTVQFIEFVGDADGQEFWAGHSITSTNGSVTNTYNFTTNLPSSATAGKSVLVATQGFANLGIVAPDYIIPDGFLLINGGTVNFPGMDSLTYAVLPTDGTLSLNANLTTGTNSPTDFAGATGTVVPAVGKTADLLVYDWKAHTLLDGVSIVDASHNGTTDANGSTSLTGITSTSLELTASRGIPGAEATLTSQAVNLQDAIAILKMIVGLDVNGAGRALSPYQSLAADYNGNGTVGLTDAIDVLKHVVGLPAPDPVWRFVNEIDATIPGKVGLNPGTLPATIGADVSGTATQVHVGLVGILNGDVDGSFAGAPGSQDLDDLQPTYFDDLTRDYGFLQLSQFGVYS